MDTIQPIIKLRRDLHQIPEVAENEYHTAKQVIDFLKTIDPDELYSDVVGTGIMAVFDSKKPGPHIIFRAELDGLPISEENTIPYASKNKGCSHSCGHDGHLAIVSGLAFYISQHKETYTGKIMILYQPAEEIAKGARDIMQSNILGTFKPTHIFGFHNVPGYPLGQVIVKKGVFALASQGLIVHIYGRTSHAGQPEKGKNPLHATIDIALALDHMSKDNKKKGKDAFVTIIHVKVGEPAFGTNPGYAVVMATYRSTSQSSLHDMVRESIETIRQICDKHHLEWKHEWVEIFPEINNSSECVDIIQRAATQVALPVIHMKKPFLWSEDFSYYLHSYNGAFFGIGAGCNQHPLHNPSYDFPDRLLSIGISLFNQIIHETIKSYTGA